MESIAGARIKTYTTASFRKQSPPSNWMVGKNISKCGIAVFAGGGFTGFHLIGATAGGANDLGCKVPDWFWG